MRSTLLSPLNKSNIVTYKNSTNNSDSDKKSGSDSGNDSDDDSNGENNGDNAKMTCTQDKPGTLVNDKTKTP